MNKRSFLRSLLTTAVMIPAARVLPAGAPGRRAPDWSLTMNVLESCSCPVFCPCFFTGKPPAARHSGHGQHRYGREVHFCQFSQACQVTEGRKDGTDLAGIRFWYAGDAGDDFAKERLGWALLSFDPAVTAPQREALLSVLRHLRWYRPERWRQYEIGADAEVEWEANAEGAHARLGSGRIAEMTLATLTGLDRKPVTVSNMSYFGFPRNSGFVLMPSKLLAYRGSPHGFEFRDEGTNGFLTTVEMNSTDFVQPG